MPEKTPRNKQQKFISSQSGGRSPRSGCQQGEVLVRTLSSQAGFSVSPHKGSGWGKRDRGKDTETQREFSGVSLREDTKPIG